MSKATPDEKMLRAWIQHESNKPGRSVITELVEFIGNPQKQNEKQIQELGHFMLNAKQEFLNIYGGNRND